jgi:hypothetical protein
LAKSGLKHIDVGSELTKTEWESEDSHEVVHGISFPSSPIERQLFYRDDEHKWYIYDGSQWVWLGGAGGGGSKIEDTDADTKVDTEGAADEDKIRMDVKGVEAFLLNDVGILTLAKQSGSFAYPLNNQTIPNGVWTTINFDATQFDVQSEFDTGNHKFIAKAAGLYLILLYATFATYPANTNASVSLWQNGNYMVANTVAKGVANYITIQTFAVLSLAINDYIEGKVAQYTGSNATLSGGTPSTGLIIMKLA